MEKGDFEAFFMILEWKSRGSIKWHCERFTISGRGGNRVSRVLGRGKVSHSSQ